MFASRSKLMMFALFLVALSFGCSSINQQIGLPEDISGVTGQDIQICLVVPLHEWILMEMVAVSMFGIAGRRDHGVSSFFGGVHFG